MRLLGSGHRSRSSLRVRYLAAASAMVVLLLAGAFVANAYVNHVTARNASSLQSRDEITNIISRFRGALWRADAALDEIMISPRDSHQLLVRASLDEARAGLESMTAHQAIDAARTRDRVDGLRSGFETLSRNILELTQRRRDPNWVWPMLPFISTTNLEANQEFESAAGIALRELRIGEDNAENRELYRRFDDVRDLWRLQILNFRAVIIRFAGLNSVDMISQERNIELIHGQIEAQLEALGGLAEEGRLDLEAEDALERMVESARHWDSGFQKVKALRVSKIWRNDVHYAEQNVRPLQEAILNDLSRLETDIGAWSSKNIHAVEHAANQINMELWALSGLAIVFVILVYNMLGRTVLRPIARIAEALSTEGRDVADISLSKRGSSEIFTLVAAFNTMQRQIHHRQVALQHQALTDSLTGLPNRALLRDRLEQAVNVAQRNGTPLAFMLLDLDRFKEINDSLGHLSGDAVLRQVALRLAECLRESDTVARLGGDEFAIISTVGDIREIQTFVERIVEAIERPVGVDQHKLYVGVSIGIAVFPDHGGDAETLIRHADIAMYSAKRGNKDFAFFDSELEEQGVAKLALLNDLRAELKNPSGQIELFYQPQVNLRAGNVKNAEALLRWVHPEMGHIAPEQFISMAEQTGFIKALSSWVIERAISDCANWLTIWDELGVSINLSAWDLEDDELPQRIALSLKKNRLPPEMLTLEITESAVMNDPIKARGVLERLNAMGVAIYIDDYGTGFSSLAYLKLLPVHGLKIDKSFVTDMMNDENDGIIVRSTIELAHNLGMSAIAEGVESREALLALREAGCDSVQGFYIARPGTLDNMRSWLAKYSPEQISLSGELLDIGKYRGG